MLSSKSVIQIGKMSEWHYDSKWKRGPLNSVVTITLFSDNIAVFFI